MSQDPGKISVPVSLLPSHFFIFSSSTWFNRLESVHTCTKFFLYIYMKRSLCLDTAKRWMDSNCKLPETDGGILSVKRSYRGIDKNILGGIN